MSKLNFASSHVEYEKKPDCFFMTGEPCSGVEIYDSSKYETRGEQCLTKEERLAIREFYSINKKPIIKIFSSFIMFPIDLIKEALFFELHYTTDFISYILNSISNKIKGTSIIYKDWMLFFTWLLDEIIIYKLACVIGPINWLLGAALYVWVIFRVITYIIRTIRNRVFETYNPICPFARTNRRRFYIENRKYPYRIYCKELEHVWGGTLSERLPRQEYIFTYVEDATRGHISPDNSKKEIIYLDGKTLRTSITNSGRGVVFIKKKNDLEKRGYYKIEPPSVYDQESLYLANKNILSENEVRNLQNKTALPTSRIID